MEDAACDCGEKDEEGPACHLPLFRDCPVGNSTVLTLDDPKNHRLLPNQRIRKMVLEAPKGIPPLVQTQNPRASTQSQESYNNNNQKNSKTH